MADGNSHTQNPAARDSGAPELTVEDVHRLIDAVLGTAATGTVCSLKGHPSLVVKEIQIDDRDEGLIDTMRLEANLLIGLSHPGILRYHQFIEDDDFVYIVMDRCRGNLDSFLADYKRLKTPVPNGLLLSVMKQVISALAYLHEVQRKDPSGNAVRGLVHTDLKPASILISMDGEHFLIAGFRLCGNSLQSSSTATGITAYTAPEALLHGEVGPASDVWSLGVIIYELATLKKPSFARSADPKSVFVEGWRPDLSDVEDSTARSVLERIFVLDAGRRATARELCSLLQGSPSPNIDMEHKIRTLEAAVGRANSKISSLEQGLRSKSNEIRSLKDTVESLLVNVAVLTKELEQKSARLNDLEARYNAFGQRFISIVEGIERIQLENQGPTRSATVIESPTPGPKERQGRKVLPPEERLPCLITISGFPEGVKFDDIKESLNKDEHADILRAIAESKQRRPKKPSPSEVSFFCTEQNGRILKKAFGNMEVDDTALCARLTNLK